MIVGGGQRGVVTTACYIARIHGVRSAMPMFKALQLCPEAVVVKPRFEAYVTASREIRAMMEDLTPAIEPLSLDEAFLEPVGHTDPARRAACGHACWVGAPDGTRAAPVRVQSGCRITSFWPKSRPIWTKPRGGFSVYRKGRHRRFPCAASLWALSGVWGLPPRAQLERAGISTIDDLLRWDQTDLVARFGVDGVAPVRSGARARYAPGQPRPGGEVYFQGNHLRGRPCPTPTCWKRTCGGWPNRSLAVRRRAGWPGGSLTVKLKRADHRSLTRRQSLDTPTTLADTIWRSAATPAGGRIGAGTIPADRGVGISDLTAG